MAGDSRACQSHRHIRPARMQPIGEIKTSRQTSLLLRPGCRTPGHASAPKAGSAPQICGSSVPQPAPDLAAVGARAFVVAEFDLRIEPDLPADGAPVGTEGAV